MRVWLDSLPRRAVELPLYPVLTGETSPAAVAPRFAALAAYEAARDAALSPAPGTWSPSPTTYSRSVRPLPWTFASS
ncbi:hypothetical protein [Streptomyces flaveus]|uniref:hypothetical protein n=1 Tax=Streptomyces flaveus TaxID=66370 RepID=UPI00331D9F90